MIFVATRKCFYTVLTAPLVLGVRHLYAFQPSMGMCSVKSQYLPIQYNIFRLVPFRCVRKKMVLSLLIMFLLTWLIIKTRRASVTKPPNFSSVYHGDFASAEAIRKQLDQTIYNFHICTLLQPSMGMYSIKLSLSSCPFNIIFSVWYLFVAFARRWS
uniref:GPI mannosyltransferase 2 n=1 Tax=Steinernema glaseri TaxID=37863 RepID=A0A1I8AGH0_9BILA